MYKGSETYQTFPGAFLTLIMKIFLTYVLVQQISAMYFGKNWSMKDQIVLLSHEELDEKINLGKYKNFKAGLEIQVNPAAIASMDLEIFQKKSKMLSDLFYVLEENY